MYVPPNAVAADVVVNVIMAAAAAVAHGTARTCATAPLYQGPKALLRQLPGADSDSDSKQQQQQEEKRDAGKHRDHGACEAQDPLLIVHCGSSTTYPLTIMESWNWGVEVRPI